MKLFILYGCNGSNNQKWTIGVSDNNGYYTIISIFNNKCLNANANHDNDGIVDNSDKISGQSCNGNDNQKWKIDGMMLRNKANEGNYCFDYYDNIGYIQIWSCDINNINQKLKFVSTSSSAAISIGYNFDQEPMNHDKPDIFKPYQLQQYTLIILIIILIINMIICVIFCYNKASQAKGYKVISIHSDDNNESDIECQ